MSKKEKSPVVCRIGNIEIRESNPITVTLNSTEYEKVVKASIATGLSVNKIIALQGQACTKCGHNEIALIIPKGILSIKKGNNGGNILTQNNGK